MSAKKSSTKSVQSQQLDLFAIMKEGQAGSELDEADKNATAERKRYDSAKVVAIELEKHNNSRLVLFESVNKEAGEWYKMGGNSALIYKYIIGPRMHKKPKIRPDKDMKHRFKGGVVAVHWGDQFVAEMAKLGYKTCQRDDKLQMLIFELDKQFTMAEIKELRQMEQREREQLNLMLRPKNDHPDLYGLILQLIKLVPPKVRKLNPDYRMCLGQKLLNDVTALLQIYMNIVNKHKEVLVAKREMELVLDDLSATMFVISENNLLDTSSNMRIATTISDLRACMERRLKGDRSK